MDFEGRHRLSVSHLLVALVAVFVFEPFVDHIPYGYLLETVLFSVVLLAAVNAVGGQWRTQVAAVLLAAPAVMAGWLRHLWPDSPLGELYLLAAIVFIIFVLVHLFRFVILATEVNAEVMCAAIAIYLLMAVSWGLIYTLIAQLDPGAFVFTEAADANSKLAGFKALYFSVQIITTTTIGDIMPVSDAARMLAMLEATVGLFYLAILVSRLVSSYSRK